MTPPWHSRWKHETCLCMIFNTYWISRNLLYCFASLWNSQSICKGNNWGINLCAERGTSRRPGFLKWHSKCSKWGIGDDPWKTLPQNHTQHKITIIKGRPKTLLLRKKSWNWVVGGSKFNDQKSYSLSAKYRGWVCGLTYLEKKEWTWSLLLWFFSVLSHT